MFKHVLMVCTGNICRSPAAEALLKHYLANSHTDVQVQSAGLGALLGFPAAKHVQHLLKERNIDVSEHRARQLKQDLIAWSDLILVMEKAQLNAIQKRFPTARGKVFCLGKWQDCEIDDPYRKDKAFFIENIKQIDSCLKDWQIRLWSNACVD